MIIDLPKKATPEAPANVPMRGIEPTGMRVREEVSLIEGRMFEFGTNEVIVGRGASGQFANLEVGNEIVSGQNRWQVVGVFEADGGVAESEIWCDARSLQGAYRRGNSYQSVLASLESADSLTAFSDWLTSNPAVNVMVRRENGLLRRPVAGADQADPDDRLRDRGADGHRRHLRRDSHDVHGRVHACARDRDAARPRLQHDLACSSPCSANRWCSARSAVLIGGLAAYLAFNGYQTSTMNFQTFSQVAFAFAVTPSLLLQGMSYALLMGLVGGLLPAIRAARLPISSALREL